MSCRSCQPAIIRSALAVGLRPASRAGSGYASDDSYSVMPFVPARHHPLGTRGGTEARLASWVNGRRVAFGGGPSPQLACELAAWVEYEVRRLLSLAGLGSTGLGRGLARPDTAGAPSRS